MHRNYIVNMFYTIEEGMYIVSCTIGRFSFNDQGKDVNKIFKCFYEQVHDHLLVDKVWDYSFISNFLNNLNINLIYKPEEFI